MNAFEGIAILGFPRSGTTLLRRLLDAHSQVDCPGESYLFTACSRFLQSYMVAGGVPVGVETGLATLGVPIEELHARLRSLVFGIRRERLAKVGKKIWAEKTAVDAFHLDAIDRILGDSLAFIGIHRHGLDVCASVRDWCEKTEGYPPELVPYIQRHPRPMEAFAHAWVDASGKLRQMLDRRADRFLLLRYEDLVADPESECRKVLEFLGLNWEEGLVERALQRPPVGFGDWRAYGASKVHRENVQRWKKLPRSTVVELAAIANPTLKLLGYEPIPVVPPVDIAEALRRYELALRLQKPSRGSPDT